MRKFKVGDEIIVVADGRQHSGSIGCVVGYYSGPVTNKLKFDYDYRVNHSGSGGVDWYYKDYEIELVKKESEYPTYDLSIEHYNLSPTFYKKEEDKVYIGDLVYVMYDDRGLGVVTKFDKGCVYVMKLSDMCIDYYHEFWVKKDHPAIKKLKEYFNQVKQ